VLKFKIINKKLIYGEKMKKNNFWKTWFKFVGLLVIIFLVWLALVFLCERLFGKTFEKFKFVHYFVLLVVILKAKKWFLKEIDYQKEDKEKNM
jgi:uncharacterized membrane protein